jgi:hypothetical protein
MKSTVTRYLLPTLICSLLLPAISTAADDIPMGSAKTKDMTGIKVGALEVHPYLTIREAYTDNVYLAPADTRDDFITTIMPGLQLQLPYRRHTFLLGTNASINRYSQYNDENTTDWGTNVAGDLNFGSRLNLKLSDGYVSGHEPRSQNATTSIEKYKNNNASGSFTYIMADISKVQLDYSNAYWKFKNSDFRTRDENQVSLYLYYRVLAKTSVFGEYEFKNVKFSNDSTGNLDNNVNSGLLGVTWELSSRSKGTVKGGYLYKQFDAESNGTLHDFTASADIAHSFSDYDSVKLVGARTVNESSLLGTRYSVGTGLNGEYTHRFMERLSTTAKASYNYEKFSDIAPGESLLRKDGTFQAGATVQYAFRRWLDSSLEYYYRKKDSNINTYDSVENNISLTLKAFF